MSLSVLCVCLRVDIFLFQKYGYAEKFRERFKDTFSFILSLHYKFDISIKEWNIMKEKYKLAKVLPYFKMLRHANGKTRCFLSQKRTYKKARQILYCHHVWLFILDTLKKSANWTYFSLITFRLKYRNFCVHLPFRHPLKKIKPQKLLNVA